MSLSRRGASVMTSQGGAIGTPAGEKAESPPRPRRRPAPRKPATANGGRETSVDFLEILDLVGAQLAVLVGIDGIELGLRDLGEARRDLGIAVVAAAVGIELGRVHRGVLGERRRSG